MSAANMLERCTPGPWSMDGAGLCAMVRGDNAVIVAVRHRAPREQHEANAQLIAFAPDHALWGAAVVRFDPSRGRPLAMWIPFRAHDDNRGEIAVAGMRHSTTLDAFGCPALTPELRAALRAALGLKEASNG